MQSQIRLTFKSVLVFGVLLLAFQISETAFGDTIYWVNWEGIPTPPYIPGTAAPAWVQEDNWAVGSTGFTTRVPVSSDDVYIYANMDRDRNDGARYYSHSEVFYPHSRASSDFDDLYIDSGGSVTLDASAGPVNLFFQENYGFVVGALSEGDLVIAGGARVDGDFPDVLTGPHVIVGEQATGVGTVSISGAGSTLASIGDDIKIGLRGEGTLAIWDGGTAECRTGIVGYMASSTGLATVSGAGSSWDMENSLMVGLTGAGAVTISDGGEVSSDLGFVGLSSGSTGQVVVGGAGSKWNCSSGVFLGEAGSGQLSVHDGGRVSTGMVRLGSMSNGAGAITVSGMESNLSMSSYLHVGEYGTGTLTIQDGGAVANQDGVVATQGSGNATIRGAGSTWVNDGELSIGDAGEGVLDILAGGRVTSRRAYIGRQSGARGAVMVGGAGSTWDNSGWFMYVGCGGEGSLAITSGGSVLTHSPHIGHVADSVGHVIVDGANSMLTHTGILEVGYHSQGDLTVRDGGRVISAGGVIGRYSDANGSVVVNGDNSTWNVVGDLLVGNEGRGTLTIENGGGVSNHEARIGFINRGEAVVRGAGSTWTSNGPLWVGDAGSLTIQDGATVRTNDTLWLAPTSSRSTVRLEGGTLWANDMQAGEAQPRFYWTGGTLKITGADVAIGSSRVLGDRVVLSAGKTLDVTMETIVDPGARLSVTGGSLVTESLDVGGTAELWSGQITIRDSFAVHSSGSLEINGIDLALSTSPQLDGELYLNDARLWAPELVIGNKIPDDAIVNLDSGLMSLSGRLTNNNVLRMGTTGSATVRANFLLNHSLVIGSGMFQTAVSNVGTIALSGDSSFSEDVTNESGGLIVLSGGSDTTFFEDVDNRAGAEIRVSANSTATYFGEVGGNGVFTGTGISYIEGDMRPGASPGIMAFEGDVILGSEATLLIEIAGNEPSDYDHLDVNGLLTMGGILEIEFIDGFVPRNGDTFEFLSSGILGGDFRDYMILGVPSGMGTNFNVTERGLSLTIVPEPSSALLIMSAVVGCALGWIRTKWKPIVPEVAR